MLILIIIIIIIKIIYHDMNQNNDDIFNDIDPEVNLFVEIITRLKNI